VQTKRGKIAHSSFFTSGGTGEKKGQTKNRLRVGGKTPRINEVNSPRRKSQQVVKRRGEKVGRKNLVL